MSAATEEEAREAAKARVAARGTGLLAPPGLPAKDKLVATDIWQHHNVVLAKDTEGLGSCWLLAVLGAFKGAVAAQEEGLATISDEARHVDQGARLAVVAELRELANLTAEHQSFLDGVLLALLTKHPAVVEEGKLPMPLLRVSSPTCRPVSLGSCSPAGCLSAGCSPLAAGPPSARTLAARPLAAGPASKPQQGARPLAARPRAARPPSEGLACWVGGGS